MTLLESSSACVSAAAGMLQQLSCNVTQLTTRVSSDSKNMLPRNTASALQLILHYDCNAALQVPLLLADIRTAMARPE
jgi:hypothetical protein